MPILRVLFCEHHLSHAASAFLCSPFDEAAILTVDGVGAWVAGTRGWGRGNHIDLREQMEARSQHRSSFGKIPTGPSRWTWIIFTSITRRAVTFNRRLVDLFGEPRPPKMLFFTAESGFLQFLICSWDYLEDRSHAQ